MSDDAKHIDPPCPNCGKVAAYSEDADKCLGCGNPKPWRRRRSTNKSYRARVEYELWTGRGREAELWDGPFRSRNGLAQAKKSRDRHAAPQGPRRFYIVKVSRQRIA